MSSELMLPNGTSLLSHPQERVTIRAILSDLAKDHHALFSVLASSYVIADDSYPYAYITMQGSRPCIGINYNWWCTRNELQKAFVLVHEGLHFMFGHMWQQMVEYVAPPNERNDNWKDAYAYAIDLMVNSACERVFQMDRQAIDPEGMFVWAQTIFQKAFKKTAPTKAQWSKFIGIPGQPTFDEFTNPWWSQPRDLKTQYRFTCWMFSLLEGKNFPQLSPEVEMHIGQLEGEGEGDAKEKAEKAEKAKQQQEAASQFLDKMSEKDEVFKKSMEKLGRGMEGQSSSSAATKAQTIVASQGATKAGSDIETLDLGKPLKLKKTWAKFVKRWNLTCLTNEDRVSYDWTQPDHRFALVTRGAAILPREAERDPDIKRTDVLVFLDFSGSCFAYAMAFLQMALTIPEERFNVRWFLFASRVREITKKQAEEVLTTRKVPSGIGSGTDFDQVNRVVNSEEKVRNVFVISDGDDSPIRMKEPKKWIWFQIGPEASAEGKKVPGIPDLSWAIKQGAHHGWVVSSAHYSEEPSY